MVDDDFNIITQVTVEVVVNSPNTPKSSVMICG